jgi:hypothetical protein
MNYQKCLFRSKFVKEPSKNFFLDQNSTARQQINSYRNAFLDQKSTACQQGAGIAARAEAELSEARDDVADQRQRQAQKSSQGDPDNVFENRTYEKC